jgi:hypothetical protein
MIQVIAMQILYGTSMAAIFVLCLVLLWTARRILRSSPLTSGALSLVQFSGTAERIDFSTDSDSDYSDSDYSDYSEIGQFDLEPEVAEMSSTLVEPMAMEMLAPEAMTANQVATPSFAAEVKTPIHAMDEAPELKQIPTQTTEVAAETEVAAVPETKRSGLFAKHLPHGYNYMLEGLLLGVSILVLIRTQRSTWRYQRSMQSSDQVA